MTSCRLTFLFVFFLTVFLAAGQVFAADSLTRTKQADVDLGTCIAPATVNGSPNRYNEIGTDGTIQYSAGYSGSSTAIAGAILVTGPLGREIRVSCETTGQSKNSTGCCGQTNRDIDTTRFVIGTANAVGPGLGTACAGVGNSPVTHFLTGIAAQDTILVSGRIRVDDVAIGGQYVHAGSGDVGVRVRDQTGNANGSTVAIDFLFSCDAEIAFSSTTDMQFGTISFATIGAADRANLATSDSMTYVGGFTGPATGIAAFATITGVENGVPLEVYCDSTATLTNGTGGSIQATNLEVDPEDGRGAIGTGSACNGTGGAAAMTFTYSNPTRDTIYIGGRLNGSTAVSFGSGGSFSTANAGGDNIEIIVLNQ